MIGISEVERGAIMSDEKKIEGFSGSQPSLVKEFRIEGLYGYRTISISSKYAATILIAKNGSGKTTLLGALDAFLKAQFGRLANFQFERIVCVLDGVENPLVLEYADLLESINIPEEGDVYLTAKKFGIDPLALLEFIECDFKKIRYDSMLMEEVFEKIVSALGYSRLEARKLCEKLYANLYVHNSSLDSARKTILRVLEDVDVVYLPTYRRIEVPLEREPEEGRRYSKRKPSLQAKLGISKRSLFSADIQFGLSDISERLSSLNQDILFDSNQGYREISANIINELINGDFEREDPSPEEMPGKDALSLFFSRLKDGKHIAPFRDTAIPDIDKIYNGTTLPTDSNKFLTYFLSKLNSVIKTTRDIELVVEDFIGNCNRYLSAQDDSAESFVEGSSSRTLTSGDDKILTLDRRNLTVKVKSLATNRSISLELLSSGEKQMISLFARLYLYPRDKIILIDEPELSLSLDWQRKILLDVIKAPTCRQVIAITHSPFIFDNELEPYAKAISLSIDLDAAKAASFDEEEGAHD